MGSRTMAAIQLGPDGYTVASLILQCDALSKCLLHSTLSSACSLHVTGVYLILFLVQ